MNEQPLHFQNREYTITADCMKWKRAWKLDDQLLNTVAFYNWPSSVAQFINDFDVCVTVNLLYISINKQLDATITIY